MPFLISNTLTRLIVFILILTPAFSAKAQEATLSESDVPYGVASSWLYGHYQLAEGNIEEALSHLHFAYRNHPDVPEIAWDFQEALVAGQYFKDALEVLDKLVKENPESPQYRLQRSHVYLQIGKEKNALADLRKLRELGIVDLDVIVGEATILAGMGKTNQAVDVCRAGLKELPDDGPRLYLTMSVILDQAGKQSELPDLLAEAVENHPDSPQLHDIRMRSLLAVGKDKEALEAALAADQYFQVLMAKPVSADGPDQETEQTPLPEAVGPPSFVVELADIYTQQGDPEKAIKILDPIYDRGELGKEASLWLARLHLGTNDMVRGIQIIDEILVKWPKTGQAWFIMGRGLQSEGKNEDALVAFARGVKYAPEDAQVRLGYLRGMLVGWEKDLQTRNKNSDQLEKVELLREEALATVDFVSAADAEGQLILGYAFRSANELQLAVIAFEKASRSPELTIPAALQMSVCFDDLEEDEKARQVLEKLRKSYPKDPEVANSLGYYLAEKGIDLDLAHDLISEALQSDPGVGAYLDSMGWVLYQQGKNDAAFDYMIQAVNVMPNDPVLLEHLGLVLLKSGQLKEAEEMLRRALSLGGDKERLEGFLNNMTDHGGRD